MKRHFLFLQGVCSPFFARLADRLHSAGHEITRINFNAGDRLYWGRRAALEYRDGVAHLPEFLTQTYERFGITDQVVFGDCRPVHRPAVSLAKAIGVRTHVFEEGYFRPHWITLEREGVNANSLLPRDPAWYREIGRGLPDFGDGNSFGHSFKWRAAHDVLYHLAGSLNPLLYPGYQTHAPTGAVLEYAGYIRRFSLLRFWKKRDDEVIRRLIQGKALYYLLPLQLNGDAQIREHSPYSSMAEVVEEVLASFARYAPASAQLVIKNHPLDTGLVDYSKGVSRLCEKYSLGSRVIYLESGNLDHIVRHAQGVVTVNSTVGAVSLGHDCPTIALANPIYNLPGLTFQGRLEDFWTAGFHPDRKLFRCFRNVLISATQINGGFYNPAGIKMAVRNCAKIIAANRSPLERLL